MFGKNSFGVNKNCTIIKILVDCQECTKFFSNAQLYCKLFLKIKILVDCQECTNFFSNAQWYYKLFLKKHAICSNK